VRASHVTFVGIEKPYSAVVGVATTPIKGAISATSSLISGTYAEARMAFRSTQGAGPSEVLRAPREAASRDEARLIGAEERKTWLQAFSKLDGIDLSKDAWLGGKAKGKGKTRA
jgi:hypothetical protein